MSILLLGVLVLVIVLWGLNVFARVDAKALANLVARVLRPLGGVVALALAAFIGVRGHLEVAIPLGMVGLGLLGWMPFGPTSFGKRTQKSAGKTSRVQSAFVEMELDHDTGAMRGRMIAGRHEGVPLEALDVATIASLMSEVDDESRALLLAYLDRREPGWREHAQGGAAAWESGPGRSGKMTEQEAYQILGLEPGATADDIGRAHRALMKKLPPDQGGSTYLAARVNEAKEVLLRRHR
jgi:hypothetical protein